MKTNWNILSKYRNELYGICIIWIMMMHMVNLKQNKLPAILDSLQFLFVRGNIGVDIFLLLSGMSLYYAFSKNSNIKIFIKNRLKRVLVPFLLISGTYCFVRFGIIHGDLWSFVKHITFYSFWINGYQIAWFLALLIPLYMLYPLVYKYILNKQYTIHKTLFLVILICVGLEWFKNFDLDYYKKIEIALCRIPIFLIGCYIGKLSFQNKEISSMWKLLFVVLTVCAICMFHDKKLPHINFHYFRGLYFLFSLPIAVCFANALYFISSDALNRWLRFFGSMSIELYLSHIAILFSFTKLAIWKNSDNGIFIFFVVVNIGAFIISYILSRYVEPKIYERLSKWNI